MKVVMIGTERRLFEANSAARARILKYGELVEELHIIALTTGPILPEIQLSRNIWLYPTNSVSPLLYPLDAVRVGKILKSKNIDLVSAQDPFESGLSAKRLARKLRAKFHIQIHTDVFSPYFLTESFLNKIRFRIARYLLPKADGIRVVSERIANSLAQSGIKFKCVPIILPIFVDVQKFLSLPPSDILSSEFPQYSAYVLMVSRLEKEKNYPLAFKAFAEVAYAQNAALVIIGSGTEKASLENLARNLNIKERVKFVGWKDSVIEEYKSATLLLSASDYEGYGLIFIEAAASGLPVVTTDVGIAREFFGDSGAYISSVGDKEALTANLALALSDTAGTAEKARIAREKAQNTFKNEDEYLAQYKLAWEKAL